MLDIARGYLLFPDDARDTRSSKKPLPMSVGFAVPLGAGVGEA